MIIEFYANFRKRENSTKKPGSGTTADKVLTGNLIEPCSVSNPVFKIERFPSDSCPEFLVYAQIPAMARWYFVRDWVWSNGLWECHLEEDVLASWKSYIEATSAYVERAAGESNGAIVDRLYPTTTNFNTEIVPLASSWNGMNISDGCFVVGIITQASAWSSAAMYGGAVTYYVFSSSQMLSLLSYLLSSTFLDDNGFPQTMTATQQISHDVAKLLINPMQYITSCMWLPVGQASISDGVNRAIQIGYYDMTGNVATAQYLDSVAHCTYVTGQIPLHPQAASRGKYLNYAPYTRLSLSIQPFGSFPLDTSFCEIGSYLHCPVVLDPITGKATMRVILYPDATHTGTGAIVYETSAMMGVPIQLAQMTPDFMTALSSAISTGVAIGSAISSGGASEVLGAAAMSLNSVGNAIDSLMPQTITQGVNGSYLERTLFLSPTLTAQHFIVVDEDNTECGRPLCAVRTLGNLSGYIKCGEATIDYPCFISEKQKILQFLHSGFFME